MNINTIKSKSEINAILAVRLTALENDRDRLVLEFKKQYQEILTNLYGKEELQIDGIEHLLIAAGDNIVRAKRKLEWLQMLVLRLETWDFVEWLEELFNSLGKETDANFRRFKTDILKRVFIGVN